MDDAGAAGDGGAVGAHRDALARQHEGGRSVVADGRLPRRDGLVGVGRADDLQVGDGPQRGDVLDGLVGRPVLADPDGVVAEDEHDLRPGQRGEAHRRAHVVEEDEERPADREDAAVAGHPDHRRTHAVLPHAVVDLPAAGRLGGLLDGVGQLGPRVTR